GFHQRISFNPSFESEFPAGLTGDDRSDDLPADIQLHLSEQSIVPNALDGTEKLVSPADCLEHPRIGFSFRGLHQSQAVDFRLGNTMVAARPSHRLNSSLVNPLFNCRIADVQ